MQPFHLAVPVHDVTIVRQFYKEVIGCTEGRSDTRWVDFDLFGHQFVIHQKDGLQIERGTNPVDGHDVLLRPDWHVHHLHAQPWPGSRSFGQHATRLRLVRGAPHRLAMNV